MISVFLHSPMHNEYLCELGNALSKRNETDITYISSRAYNYKEKINFPLMDLYPDNASINTKSGKLFSHLKALAALARELIAKRPEVFHIQGFRYAKIDWPILLVAKALGMKIIFTVHNLVPHESTKSDYIIYNSIYKIADHLIAHTEHTAMRLVDVMRIPRSKISIIPHGHLDFQTDLSVGKKEARRRLGLSEDVTVLLFFGRIRHYKGVDLLMEAVKLLDRKDILLIIAGQDMIGLGKMIQKDPSVLFIGNYIDPKEVNAYFRAADLAVLPYRKIDQSGVLLLAMSAETPVLGTRVGGIQEIIEDGINGFLCDADSVIALKSKIEMIFSNKSRLTEIGKKAKQTVEKKFGWEPIAAETVNLYSRLARSVESAESFQQNL